MPLLKLKDFDPNYRETWGTEGLEGYDVYTDVADEKIGTVKDLLVDDQGHFRYLIVDLGFWKFGKSVLAPVGRCRVDEPSHRVYLIGFTRKQAENLPEFGDHLKIDQAYEKQVRGVYRPVTSHSKDQQKSPLENAVPLESPYVRHNRPSEIGTEQHQPSQPNQRGYADPTTAMNRSYATPGEPMISGSGTHRQTNDQYTTDPQEQPGNFSEDLEDDSAFYDLDEKDHLILRLYQERLQARKKRDM